LVDGEDVYICFVICWSRRERGEVLMVDFGSFPGYCGTVFYIRVLIFESLEGLSLNIEKAQQQRTSLKACSPDAAVTTPALSFSFLFSCVFVIFILHAATFSKSDVRGRFENI
jgi:hypothetical protein